MGWFGGADPKKLIGTGDWLGLSKCWRKKHQKTSILRSPMSCGTRPWQSSTRKGTPSMLEFWPIGFRRRAVPTQDRASRPRRQSICPGGRDQCRVLRRRIRRRFVHLATVFDRGPNCVREGHVSTVCQLRSFGAPQLWLEGPSVPGLSGNRLDVEHSKRLVTESLEQERAIRTEQDNEDTNHPTGRSTRLARVYGERQRVNADVRRIVVMVTLPSVL